MFSRSTLILVCLLTAWGLSACSPGSNDSDTDPNSRGSVTSTEGPDSFLLFPNPQKQDDGSYQTNSAAYATAYYEAIDPNNERDTLAKFKAKNGFGTTGANITEETIIVGDRRDLGYGRKMTGRQNADGTLAFVVENYMVGAYGGYSSLNVEAAVNGEAKWHLGTNGIEFSPGPGGGTNFVKFYTYDPVTGARLTQANLDGRGYKAMPAICISCHGGRGDPLTPNSLTTGKPLFPKLMNSVSGARGDVAAQLHPFEPASFDFSTSPAFTRAMQEAKMKKLNQMVLCSFPKPAGALDEAGCRRAATINEYQGTAAEHLRDMYGTGMTLTSAKTTDTYVPSNWESTGQTTLYLNAQAESCRVCHLLRGTGNQSDIDFATFTKFDGYADRIKRHVLDRGNMPLAKLIYDKFWSTPSIYNAMATYLTSKGYSNTSTKPGNPVADAGPDRVYKQAAVPLSASMSLFSTGYQWSIVSQPGAGATISNATSASATLNSNGDGNYTVQLITTRGSLTSAADTVVIKVDSGLSYDPVNLRFVDIRAILQTGVGNCVSCHYKDGTNTVIPPIVYAESAGNLNFDRNENGVAEATDNKTNDDNHWFYKEVRGRINFTDIEASPLLRKPSGNHHNGNQRLGFHTHQSVGHADRVDYDKIVGWILNGAPE